MHRPNEFETFVDLLRYRAQSTPDQFALGYLADADGALSGLTYTELDRAAGRVALALLANVGRGERALLLFPPGLDFVTAFVGCLYAGVIAVPAYPPRSRRRLARLEAIAADSRASVVLTMSAVLPNAIAQFDDGRQSFIATDDLDEREPQWTPPAASSSDLAFLQYTSGSTSTPKGVMVSHRNLLQNSEYIRTAFELGPDSVSVSWLPSYHDMGLIDGVLQPLYSGFKGLLMSPTAFLQEPLRWLLAITEHRATHSGGPDFAYALCVQRIPEARRAGVDLRSWVGAYNGAEPVRASTLRDFSAEFRGCGFEPRYFFPCYGLAEGTLMVTGGRLAADPVVCEVDSDALQQHRVSDVAPPAKAISLVGSGHVHLDTRLTIVDPESLAPVAPDEVGEIWVSGASVADGYWQRPEDTREVFRAHLAGSGEGPFLRTGDLGFLRDGELFVTGRLKDLLIVRGRNHYPQDIEAAAWTAHEGLRPGCAAAFMAPCGGEEALVVVQEVERSHSRRVDVGAVTAAIRRQIAEQHDLQVHAVVLLRPGTIAKTSSGKIQRHACRQQFLDGQLSEVGRRGAGEAGEAIRVEVPSNLLELAGAERQEQLESYWVNRVGHAAGLALRAVDKSRSLIQLGLDSLRAIELGARVERDLGVSLSPAELLGDTSAAQLLSLLGQRLGAVAPEETAPAAPVALGTRQPLSPGQQALWFLHHTAPASAAYNVFMAVAIHTPLDVAALRQTLALLARRHDSLRSVFEAHDGVPAQRALPDVTVRLEETDASGWSADTVHAFLEEKSHAPFDLAGGEPAFRVLLLRRGPAPDVMLLVAHHILMDFWSFGSLLTELGDTYASLCEQRPPALLGAATIQPAAYVRRLTEWLESPAGDAAWQYWRAQLEGAPTLLNLSTRATRPPVVTHAGETLVQEWPAALVQSLRAVAQREGVTLYTLLLAAFDVLLFRYTGQEDILVGTSVAGRSRAELWSYVGYVANQVVLRARLAGNPTFSELLKQTRHTVLAALEHERYPFATLVERLRPVREASFSPLVQVMFVYEPALRFEQTAGLVSGVGGRRARLGGLELESMAIAPRSAQFDLTLKILDDGTGSVANWEYDTQLFSAGEVRQLARHLEAILGAVCENVDAPIEELPLLSHEEREQVLVAWNRTEAPVPAVRVRDLLERAMRAHPDAVAIVHGSQRVLYRELEQRVAALSERLKTQSIGPEDLVAVLLRRTPELIVALLAVLDAGAAYLPLAPDTPAQRLGFILEDSAAALLLTEEQLIAQLPASAVPVVCMDAPWPRLRARERPARAATTDDLVYVIYTSGSTGTPKGVQVTNRGLVNYLVWAAREYGAADGIGAPVNTSIAFDATVTSVFLPLMTGGQLALVSEERELDGLASTLASTGDFSLVKLTPAQLELLQAELPPQQMSGRTRRLVVGGEALRASTISAWRTHAPDTLIINEYGPTETVVGCSVHTVGPDTPWTGQVSIGRPIANTRLYVLDRHLQPVPVGVVGELYIAGAGVARGYVNRPELTAERFVRDPFAADGSRFYRSGDLARQRADGSIEFIGRKDGQVKIRGFRIEIAEIESALQAHANVRECAVVCEERGDDKRLVAFVVLHADGTGQHELRQFLGRSLPSYMLPALIVFLPELPQTANGKLRREALVVSRHSAEVGGDATAAATPLERTVASVWREVLGVDDVGLDQNFFEVGGHSLLAVRLHRRLSERLCQDFPLVDVLQYPTIRTLARRFSQGTSIQPEEIQAQAKRQLAAAAAERSRARRRKRA